MEVTTTCLLLLFFGLLLFRGRAVALLLFLGGGRGGRRGGFGGGLGVGDFRLLGRRGGLGRLRGLRRGGAHGRCGLGFGGGFVAAGGQSGDRKRGKHEFQFHCYAPRRFWDLPDVRLAPCRRVCI